MTEQTIAERFCDTTNSTALQLLQDEAAMLGAQGLVSKQLEAELTCAERPSRCRPATLASFVRM